MEPYRIPVGLAEVHSSIVACEACPRLRTYCRRVAREKKRAHRHEAYWGRPVPGFGDPNARLLLVGLAPAAHGANRTGRVFTGDGSGDVLMSALHRTGFANIPTSRRLDDGLRLTDAYILAAVRCAPPGNKPLPEEITRCLGHLDAEVAALPRVRVVVALGKIGFDAWLQLMRRRGVTVSPKPQFGHGVVVRPFDSAPGELRRGVNGAPSFDPSTSSGSSRASSRDDDRSGRPEQRRGAWPTLVGCYHPSRQNTNTGKLTTRMIESVFRKARRLLDADVSALPPA